MGLRFLLFGRQKGLKFGRDGRNFGFTVTVSIRINLERETGNKI